MAPPLTRRLLCFDTYIQEHTFQGSTSHSSFFLLHERKFEACHEELFAICCRLVPPLSKCAKPIVTDEEQHSQTRSSAMSHWHISDAGTPYSGQPWCPSWCCVPLEFEGSGRGILAEAWSNGKQVERPFLWVLQPQHTSWHTCNCTVGNWAIWCIWPLQ